MKSILFASLCFFLLGCSAPHDNPLDPKSDRYVAPQPQPNLPDFIGRVWSEHKAFLYPPGVETWNVIYEFANEDTAFTVDSVWISYDGRPEVWVRRSNGVWASSFNWTYFSCGQQMECVMGEPFSFVIRDVLDGLYYLGPLYVYRVISGVPSTSDPDSSHVTGPRPFLEWPPFGANFPFSFRATVWYPPVTDSIVWVSPLLPAQQYLVETDSLANGSYEWTLTVVDSFGNSSRSKEAAFIVSSGVLP